MDKGSEALAVLVAGNQGGNLPSQHGDWRDVLILYKLMSVTNRASHSYLLGDQSSALLLGNLSP